MPDKADNKLKFIVCAPRYDDTSGGSIVLHKLAQILGTLGHEALLWPLYRIPPRPRPFSAAWWRRISYVLTRTYRPWYHTRPGSILRLAKPRDISEAIVVYPEIIHGNPLNAARYVRWMLYGGPPNAQYANYSPEDLYFCFQKAFDRHYDGLKFGGILYVVDLMLDIYVQTNFRQRSGVCYMIRKGKARSDLPSLDGKLVVDGLKHRRLAKIFNEKQYCYFYDPYTAYSSYAAACGCIPVVVPVAGIPADAWEPDGGSKPGIAYGEAQIRHAVRSRRALLERMAMAEQRSTESVERFVEILKCHFELDTHAK